MPRDHLMLVRVRSDATFMPTREQLRSAIASGVEAWGGDFTLVSLSPLQCQSDDHKGHPARNHVEKASIFSGLRIVPHIVGPSRPKRRAVIVAEQPILCS